jgi:hypothetical protein
MEGKNAMILNQIADGQKIQCNSCGSMNDPDSAVCAACGAVLLAKPASAQEAAFSSAVPERSEPAASVVQAQIPMPAFADGLAEWDLLPPQVVVRRLKK